MKGKKVQDSDIAIVQPAREMSVGEMMGALASRPDITTDTVAVMKELVGLKREMDKDAARNAFNRAFVGLQRGLQPIAAQRIVPGNDGKVRYKFAAFEDLMEGVQPLLDKHDFCLSFSTKTEASQLCVTATLMHIDGHERSSEFAVRAGGRGAPGCSDAQVDGGNFTFAKRYAMCGLLNIVIDKDTDASLLGDTISKADADDLYRRVNDICKGDDSKMNTYLKLAGADSFEKIKQAKYEVVIQVVESRERQIAASK